MTTTGPDRLSQLAGLDGAEPEQLERLVRVGPGVLLLSTIAVGLVTAVDAELAERLARVATTGSVFNAIGAAFVEAASCPLMVWLTVFGGVSLARISVGLAVARHTPARRNLRPWALWAVGGLLLHSALWGVVCIVLLKEGNAHFESALHIVLLAVTMGAVVPLAGFFRVQAGHVLLTLGPLLLRDFLIGGQYHGFLGALSVLVGAYTLINGRNQSRALNEVLAQRQRNTRLVEALRQENERSEAARRLAEEANAAKTRFLAAANHDLRQPLHAMGLLAQTLRAPGSTTNAGEVGGHIVECVDGMTRVVDELLDITRLDVGNMAPQWSAFALDELLAEICRPCEALARAKGLALVVMGESAIVRSDRALLARVISNLVSNAIRYTPAGGVRILARVQGQQLHLSVEDSGIGIAQDQLSRIFEEFYQVGNPARDRRLGLGLGLATVKRLSDTLALQVSVRSTLGQGSVFELTLPLAAPEEPVTALAVVDDLTIPRVGAQQVLVVEDDSDSRSALVGLLQTWGCVAHAAGCEASAVALLRSGICRPDALVVDLRLADGASGIDVIRALRCAANAEMPTVIVTGDVGGERMRAARALGFAVLVKPVRPVQLRAFLNQAFALQ
jgi:signal transduction histidine kinase